MFFPHQCLPLTKPGQVLFAQPLDANNYAIWSRAITMSLEARNELGFIDDSLLKPGPNNANIYHWVHSNSMVQSWNINSTIPSLPSYGLRLLLFPLQKFQKYPWFGFYFPNQIVSGFRKIKSGRKRSGVLCLSLISRVSVDRYITPT